MNSPETPASVSTNWPPEGGWPLFLAWVGGVLVVSLLYSVMGFAGLAYHPGNRSHQVLWALPALAGHAWQAWLLFRKHPVRFGLWTALPLLQFIIPDPVRYMDYMSLVIPLAEAALLRNIRRRAWAWILASMAGVVLSSGLTHLFYRATRPQFMDLMNDVGAALGVQLAGLAQIGFSRGLWLLGEVLCAAILAWKMPPLRPGNGEPKPDPASTNQ
jgi:hypothetical protein